MGCIEFKKLWEKYENGTLTQDRTRRVRKSYRDLRDCEVYLDELLAKSEPIKKRTTTTKFESPVFGK